jgi:hypothetical protein
VKFLAWEIHHLRRHPVSGDRELPWDILQRDLAPNTRAIVAKAARSEVKNYIAYLAEQAQMPYTGPEGFIEALRQAAFIVAIDRREAGNG